MRKPWSWRKGLVVLAITVAAFTALPVAQAQQVLVPGAVVALEGTPHLWIADAQGVLHWGGDTRALAGRHINWGARIEVSLAGLRALPKGDPWLSSGLLKDGDPIYLVKWETEWPLPRLLHIQSIADVELFGINETNYGNFVLERAAWEARYGISAAGLQRAELPPAVLSPGMTPTTPTTPATPTTTGTAGLGDIPYQNIRGFDVGIGQLDLPQGDVTLMLEFGGWGKGPVTVTYQIGDGAPVHLFNNENVPYFVETVLSVPQAATYTFKVNASRNWRIWVGLEPGLPSVPLPLEGCRATKRWHKSQEGVHSARFDCGGVRLDGTSYSDVNDEKRHWVVWFRDRKFLEVTSTGTVVTTTGSDVQFQSVRGYGNGSGELTLPQGQVTLMVEYGNWSKAPMTLTYRTPGGEHVTLFEARSIPFLSSWTINAPQAGNYMIQINAERDWRVWVGVDAGSISRDLADAEVPVDGCNTVEEWKRASDGTYRAEFKCPKFDLNGTFYPGLNKGSGFWIVWSRGSDFHEVTFEKT